MTILKYAVGVALLSASAGISVSAQPAPRTEDVRFPRGATSATVRGTIKGYESVDYVIGARAGQTLTVSARSPNRSLHFNVLPPRSPEALFVGSNSGSRFSGKLQQDGAYRVRVYLMRNAARRGEQASFSLDIAVSRLGGVAGGGAQAGQVGSGPALSDANMPAFCRGEASSMYGTRPNYVRTGPAMANAAGKWIDGTVDQGSRGMKRFRCRFDARGRFIDVLAMTPDGE